jgi:hypothetical protein
VLQSHSKFQSVASLAPLLFSRELQMGAEKKPNRMELGEAVSKVVLNFLVVPVACAFCLLASALACRGPSLQATDHD